MRVTRVLSLRGLYILTMLNIIACLEPSKEARGELAALRRPHKVDHLSLEVVYSTSMEGVGM